MAQPLYNNANSSGSRVEATDMMEVLWYDGDTTTADETPTGWVVDCETDGYYSVEQSSDSPRIKDRECFRLQKVASSRIHRYWEAT